MVFTSFAAPRLVCSQLLTSLTTAAQQTGKRTLDWQTEDRDPSSVDDLSNAAFPRSEWEDSPDRDQILGAAHGAQLLANAHSTRCPGRGPRVNPKVGCRPKDGEKKGGRPSLRTAKGRARPKWDSTLDSGVTGCDQAAHHDLAAGTGSYRYLLAGW
ncbi:hypothetical protein PAAG_11222 [Paracoccidioides lutzii Pb01]|uniref:Uncharacterized protein n=1 Tax=Paracoccidioides lutzii (strain ATCC MYA-826 / Pb01) TaxID=502779 RepID=A0A0A2VMH2_PARBA|nr:hypothetical protein PAAG_11222 [Paracoccidioides lutzii Pb01]KGQ02044.1 hypothetical protein PAAG_11222 [Paracoccidioides lutzii Pb01]